MVSRSDDPGVASASPKLVRAVMAELGLRAWQPRADRVTTLRGRDEPATVDLVGRDCTAPGPGRKLVRDITSLRTRQGWAYVATVIDCPHQQRHRLVDGGAPADLAGV